MTQLFHNMIFQMWGDVLICACILFLSKIHAIPNGNCYLSEIKDIHWITSYTNDPVDDFEEKEFKRFVVNNTEDVEIRAGDDYEKYFNARIENKHLIIFPTEVFKLFEINENSTINPEMNVRLYFNCTTGTRQLSFYQPIRDHNTYCPEFNQPFYTYTLPMPLPAKFDLHTLGETIIACDLDISNVRLDFAINPADDFSISWDGPIDGTNKCHKAILKTINPLRLISDKVYQIIVTDTGDPPLSKSAKLIVQVDEKNSIPPTPQFESAYYTSTYNFEDDKHSIVVDHPIRVKNGCSNMKLDLIEYEANFQVECNLDEVTVDVISSLSDGIVENTAVVLVTIVATLERAEKPGETVLVVNIPKNDCSEATAVASTIACPSSATPTECPVCPTGQITSYTCPPCNTECPSTPTECPPCSTRPPEEDTALSSKACAPCSTTPKSYSALFIKFRQNYYWFEVESWYQGYVGIVTAIAIPKEVIKYSFEDEKDFIKIDENTGILKIVTKMDTGTYSFVAYAEGVRSKLKAETNIIVNIVDGVDKLKTMNSLLTEHIVENEGRYIKFPCQCDYCAYKISEQYPETYPKLFEIYNKTQIYAIPLDREMDEIINMKVPQFMLRLILTSLNGCHANNSNNMLFKKNNLHNEEITREWAFLPAMISNEPDQLIISVIIDDANDNPPVFEAGVELVVGYPVKELAQLIAPPYVAKVKATDLDEGINAKIRYSTESTHFVVHPETGVIYPTEDAFGDDSSLKFNVKATDKNGADDGLSANLMVEVKPLRQAHLIVLTVKNLMLEDIDNAMKTLSNKTNMQIKYLTASIIPVLNSEESSLINATAMPANLIEYSTSEVIPNIVSKTSFARIIVYGLNADEPIAADDLQNTLEDSKVLEDITIDKVNSGAASNFEDHDENFNRIHLIIATVILSILLVFFIISSTALYYFKIYKARKLKPCTLIEEEGSNTINSKNNPGKDNISKFEEITQSTERNGICNIPPIPEGSDKLHQNKVIAGYIDPETDCETVDDAKKELEFDISSAEVNKSRRKSKKEVPKITIVVEDTNDGPDRRL